MYLESHFDAETLLAAIRADYYSAYRWAANNGHLEVVQYLESHFNADNLLAAISANNYV